jgi:hypothetical protein
LFDIHSTFRLIGRPGNQTTNDSTITKIRITRLYTESGQYEARLASDIYVRIGLSFSAQSASLVKVEGNTCAVMETLSLNSADCVVYLLRERLLSITRLSEL